MDEQLIATFCDVDDFCKEFEAFWYGWSKELGLRCRIRRDRLSLSELMTIAIMFHFSQIRTFKAYYFMIVSEKWRSYFPKIPSYQRVVLLLQDVALPLQAFLMSRNTTPSDEAYMDSTYLEVCHFNRRNRNRVFKVLATTGKTSTCWFYGMKLHIIVNKYGELLSHRITTGAVDDRTPVLGMTKGLSGLLIGDKGYISDDLEFTLANDGIKLVTRVKDNMCFKRVLSDSEKDSLRKRGFIETINDQLKNVLHIAHTRYRSVRAFFVNVLAGLAAYTLKPDKPSLA